MYRRYLVSCRGHPPRILTPHDSHCTRYRFARWRRRNRRDGPGLCTWRGWLGSHPSTPKGGQLPGTFPVARVFLPVPPSPSDIRLGSRFMRGTSPSRYLHGITIRAAAAAAGVRKRTRGIFWQRAACSVSIHWGVGCKTARAWSDARRFDILGVVLVRTESSRCPCTYIDARYQYMTPPPNVPFRRRSSVA